VDGPQALLILLAIIILGGAVTGILARWLLPGPDPMSLPKTVLYGIAGSFIGGMLYQFLLRSMDLPMAFQTVFSVAGAALLIWFFRRRRQS